MKKAFTLIELLAVIILLAIVALIATPIILDVIDDARISAGRSEANMILSGINNYCDTEEIKFQMDSNYSKICTSSMDKDDVLTMVNLGNATIDKITYNGSKLTELVITSNNHKFTLCPSGTFSMDDEECDGEVEQSGNLISTLLQQYQEGNEVGLVKDNTNPNLYYYTGTNEEVANNFLWYGGHQWRVLEFNTEEKTLTLITQQPLTAIYPSTGIWDTQDEYKSSYINKWLNNYFWNSLDSSIQFNIKDSTFNVGIYTDVDEITTIQKVGLLDEEQYKRAGELDSFLDIKDDFWLGNRQDLLYHRYVGNGALSGGQAKYNYKFGVRAVVRISDVFINEGDGTLYNNYRKISDLKNFNDVQVGEYISLTYSRGDGKCGNDNMCLFRVVSKDIDKVKLIFNGVLDRQPYLNEASITPDSIIYSHLNYFKQALNEDYLTKGDFGKGIYGDSPNYADVYFEVINEYIGLPTVGEMFSGNDIDLSTSNIKIFVDVNTIENPIINDYWTMNRYDYDKVNFIYDNGGLYNMTHAAAGGRGLRPVIYLKSGLTFTSGEGTAQSPYILQ